MVCTFLKRCCRARRPVRSAGVALTLALALAVSALASAAGARDWGLTLFVTSEAPLTAGGGPVSYKPGSRAVARLLFENRGEAPLEKVRVDVTLVGAMPVAETGGVWKRNGNDIATTIDVLAPGDTVELPVTVELADGTERGARGTGGEARIRASVPATGETVVAEANWPIASCADAYHAALRQVRYNQFAALQAAVDAARDTDASLPGGREIPFQPEGGKQVAAAVRFAEGFARAKGLDSYYTSKDMRWVTGRLLHDIAVYLGQDRYPGLCTGVAEWTAILEDYMGRFTKHAGELKSYRDALEPTVSDLVAAASEGTVSMSSGDDEAWETAAALLAGAGYTATPPNGADIFSAVKGALPTDPETMTADQRQAMTEAFAALERLWYLNLAVKKASAVADGFTGTLDAIRDAQKATCTCNA